MSKKKRSEDPSEFWEPEKNPEINPAIVPEEPALPRVDPEIIPEKEPIDPSPAEIPVPPQKN
ncbi:MAG TPA: hypothetical protein VIH61_00550 [Waddliaceae bacterium]